MGKLIIDGNQVYEIDEECMRKKEQRQKEQREGGRDMRGRMGQNQPGRRKG